MRISTRIAETVSKQFVMQCDDLIADTVQANSRLRLHTLVVHSLFAMVPSDDLVITIKTNNTSRLSITVVIKLD